MHEHPHTHTYTHTHSMIRIRMLVISVYLQPRIKITLYCCFLEYKMGVA